MRAARWWVCGRKQRYARWEVAKQSARELQRRIKKPVSAYRCPYCDGFHIGKTPKRLLRKGKH